MIADGGHQAIEAQARGSSRWLARVGAVVGLACLSVVFSEGLFTYAVLVVVSAALVSSIITKVGIAGLDANHRIDRQLVSVGDRVKVEARLENGGKWPTLFAFWQEPHGLGFDRSEGTNSVAFASLPAGGRLSMAFELRACRRGVFRVGPTQVDVGDPLGLADRRFSAGDQSYLTVVPSPVEVGGRPVTERPTPSRVLRPVHRSWFYDSSRTTGIRRFRTGDERRDIHWRATAKSGVLQVKQYEPAGLDGSMIALEMAGARYGLSRDPMVAEQAPCEQLELAVTTAVSLAERAFVDSTDVGLISNGWPFETAIQRPVAASSSGVVIRAGRGAAHLENLRIALARLCVSSRPPMATLLTRELPSLDRNLHLALVTPKLGDRLTTVIRSLLASNLSVSVFVVAESRPTSASLLPAGCSVSLVSSVRDLEDLLL